ncbi:MAG: DNA-3-methyladenine glycosylase family protein [Bacillota bacterium]|uniref:DNA-3-methyladenine glycosylase II n=2 Tax=Carboxydocella TaxID=178898 RepID=A0A1T4QPC3_9FIRM|nr:MULTISPECIES: DNA-3-methyladenine glycosylase [Carboxydocella]AVX21549.1 DNA-3-methyladenine glycosylase II [Carboxydocella thermautotrophica]AVX32030.1 DNA-3-methyladenine glycosylase II [Carboxydocella thermautotrophica]SKA05544.1 DNA-3-methyladenine glycosylase II [Carboxydocella sporoproducens DSM 16521]GAW27738.1 hypothetical protein ULO1_03080 [Carboxydocella sp. ULO1]GAW31930.1 hypothetical protein JDF658_16950 [Carboxydocella sp. JDF658]
MQHEFYWNPPAPTDLPGMLKRMRSAGQDVLYRLGENGLQKALSWDGRPVLLTVQEEGTVTKPCWHIEVAGPELPPDWQERAIAYLSHVFCLNFDLPAFYQFCRQHLPLAALVERFYGQRMILEPTLYEAAISSIIAQQLNLSFCAQLKRNLLVRCNCQWHWEGVDWLLFPEPQQLVRLTAEDLRLLKFSRSKAEYVLGVAQATATGQLNWSKVETMPEQEAMSYLISWRGIGRWTAECILLFGQGRSDLLPAADIGLRNAVGQLWGLGRQATEAEVREIGEGWRPYRSWVTHYLWLSLTENSGKDL